MVVDHRGGNLRVAECSLEDGKIALDSLVEHCGIEGLAYFKAICEFLVDRYTREDQEYGWAFNHIVGNEVNSHWWWTNMGQVTMEEYLEDYLRTVRVASIATRKICTAARVYVSLDHHWQTAKFHFLNHEIHEKGKWRKGMPRRKRLGL